MDTESLSYPIGRFVPEAPSADARLRSLYTEEWTWRQQELGRGAAGDRFPRVDAASQQARLAYWTRTLATLDTTGWQVQKGEPLFPKEKPAA